MDSSLADTMNIKVILLVSMVVVLESGRHVDAQGNGVKMADAINGFGIRLYKDLAKTNPNLICSGYGVTTVLNMLLTGARSDTEKELRDFLGYNAAGLSKQQAEASYHNILRKQRSDHVGYDLSVTNTIFIQSGVIVSPAYTNALWSIYYAISQRIDFASPTATNQTNTWVSIATKNKIPKFFDVPIDISTSLILVSAMYFRGTWQTKFNPEFTTQHPFNNGSSTKDILFIDTVNNFPYYENKQLDVQVLELPYEGGDTSMIIVLPGTATGLPGLEKISDLSTFKLLITNLRVARVHVTIPKFASSSNLQLNDVMKSFGLNNSFTPSADFTGIDSQRNLFLSKIIQKTGLEVTEDGTISASASAILVKRQSGVTPPNQATFIADHPFFYAIFHRATGVILFMGRMTEA